jgi:glycosyltransferase involved in cell wall biosynthesis
MRDALPISLIMPVFNGAVHIGEALASAIAERVAQVIVVDDGSTDGSGEIAAGFGPTVEVVRQENAGAAAARNRALPLIGQPFVHYLDADDLLPSGALSLLHSRLVADAQAHAYRGTVRYFMDRPGEEGEPRRELGTPLQSATITGTLFRSEMIHRVGSFSTDMRVGSDLDWMKRALETGMIIRVCDEVVLHIRRHGRSLTADRTAVTDAFFDIVRRSLARGRESGR